MRVEHAHQPFDDAVWAQQDLPTKRTASSQALVKRCPERVCQASDAERLQATLLFDATVRTTWYGTVGDMLAREILGESVEDFPIAPKPSVRIPHRCATGRTNTSCSI